MTSPGCLSRVYTRCVSRYCNYMSSSDPTSEEKNPLLSNKAEGQDSSTETESNSPPTASASNSPSPASSPTASCIESQQHPSVSKDEPSQKTNSSKGLGILSFFRSTSEYTSSTRGTSVDKGNVCSSCISVNL